MRHHFMDHGKVASTTEDEGQDEKIDDLGLGLRFEDRKVILGGISWKIKKIERFGQIVSDWSDFVYHRFSQVLSVHYLFSNVCFLSSLWFPLDVLLLVFFPFSGFSAVSYTAMPSYL
ncbi:hypothetical protein VNO78_10290 [Psophocarpus tetragonolobus]|uniref:Transmembrane protein n=1 Tax=Psophocarpus tetragonolobus TaxID=3891 RepID=A0AAN9XML4_PSOTE